MWSLLDEVPCNLEKIASIKWNVIQISIKSSWQIVCSGKIYPYHILSVDQPSTDRAFWNSQLWSRFVYFLLQLYEYKSCQF
jgi:hypothetical protein